MTIARRENEPETSVDVLIIGAGACGLVAALASSEAGAEVMVLERDNVPAGSTALSSGFIPAYGTRWQAEAGVEDSVSIMSEDIQAKNHDEADPVLVEAVASAAGPTLEWLADQHGQQFVLLDGFLYPGHRKHRMHAHPNKTGAALIASLATAVEAAEVPIVTNAHVTRLLANDEDRVVGVELSRPDGSVEEIGCKALILACNGYGGNSEMVKQHIPEMADALYFGHVGNQGDAVSWGEALGGEALNMGSYQGHGSVAHPHGALITWALMMEGGIQVDILGKRFSNEHEGYSEQSVKVLAQPEQIAWNLYDERLHQMGMGFEDYRGAEAAGAIKRFDNLTGLAEAIGCDEADLTQTLEQTSAFANSSVADPFGRDFSNAPALAGPPYYAVRVTGALFHTQGGLSIDAKGRVLRRGSGQALPNLLAGGGAAVGVSGKSVSGYLSGNGLLTAVALGKLTGEEAARLVREGA